MFHDQSQFKTQNLQLANCKINYSPGRGLCSFQVLEPGWSARSL